MQGNNSRRDKLKKFSDRQKKHSNERLGEAVSEVAYLDESIKKNSSQRSLDEAIPNNNFQWLKDNGHEHLLGHYENYVQYQATTLNKATKFLSQKLGIKLDKEHPISVSGDDGVELSPTTPLSDRGPNDQGFPGNKRYNNRMGAKNSFERYTLDELGIASNWQYSASNFVAERPDIRDPAVKAAFKPPLPPLSPRVSNLGMLKLQQGELDVDTLQMKMFIESDLKRSGLVLNPEQQGLLGAMFKKIEQEEISRNAFKHSWLHDKNGLVLDDNGQPIPTGQYDLDKHKPHRSSGEGPDGRTFGNQDNKTGKVYDDDAWLTKRVQEGQNAVKRHNPTFTELPNGENGENGDNGKTNGKNNGHDTEVPTNGKKKTNGIDLGSGVGKTRRVDQALNIGKDLATGNYTGAAVQGSTAVTAEVLKSKAAQKAIAEQISKIAAKRGGKTALKMIPGLDILISGGEAWDYLKRGDLDQAGIAAVSGAIGWIPIIGDGASASLDLANTAIDIARLQRTNRSNKKNKNKLETDVPDTKLKSVSRALKNV